MWSEPSLDSCNVFYTEQISKKICFALTTKAHSGKLLASDVSINHHHAGAVVPLHLETTRAAYQVHVARVIDFKAILFKTGLGIPGVDIELIEDIKFYDLISLKNFS